jgi:hypothetical protein
LRRAPRSNRSKVKCYSYTQPNKRLFDAKTRNCFAYDGFNDDDDDDFIDDDDNEDDDDFDFDDDDDDSNGSFSTSPNDAAGAFE